MRLLSVMSLHPASILGFATALYGCFFWTSVAAAQPEMSVPETFDYLRGPESTFPNDFTKKDREAIKVFRENPKEGIDLIVAKFRSNELTDETIRKYLLVVSEPQKREIIQEILKKYAPGAPGTPFLGYLAYFGDAQDMERLKAIFVQRPNDDDTRDIATLMAQSANTHAHAALLRWKDQLPGKWQESPDVQKHFSKNAATGRNSSLGIAVPSAATTDGAKGTSPATRTGQTHAADPAAHGSKSWLLWIAIVLGGTVIVWRFVRPK